jgi:hypothetical protein
MCRPINLSLLATKISTTKLFALLGKGVSQACDEIESSLESDKALVLAVEEQTTAESEHSLSTYLAQ